MFTGLSRESARFQARSAFSGVGFSTEESESIMHHPVRRQIIMILMLLGNIGIATVIATVMISVSSTVGADFSQQLIAFGILGLGLLFLWMFFSSRWVERRMNMIIGWALRQFTDLEVRDYNSLLKLADGYSVSEMLIEPKHWLAGCILKDIRLSDEGILILGIRRNKTKFMGIPRANDTIESGDVLIVYGKLENIKALDRRRAGNAGDKQHAERVEQQLMTEEAERLGEARDVNPD